MKLEVFEHNARNQCLKVSLVDELYLIGVLLMRGVDGLLWTVFVVMAPSELAQVYIIQNNRSGFHYFNELPGLCNQPIDA